MAWLARSTETDPSRPRRCNSLRLAPMDILALHLRHVAQQLQHNIGNQGVGHIRRAAGPDARVKQMACPTPSMAAPSSLVMRRHSSRISE